MHKRTQSHTDCICLTFLHCVFLNVSSNHLHERMQNHIGCICLTFLNCAISNCSTFHHCAFSNVSSNCLLEKRHSHIGYICLTPLCVFIAHTQIHFQFSFFNVFLQLKNSNWGWKVSNMGGWNVLFGWMKRYNLGGWKDTNQGGWSVLGWNELWPYMHHTYMHASGSKSRIIDMCIIHTCIRVKDRGKMINASYMHVSGSCINA